jgi:hypothetical protein
MSTLEKEREALGDPELIVSASPSAPARGSSCVPDDKEKPRLLSNLMKANANSADFGFSQSIPADIVL